MMLDNWKIINQNTTKRLKEAEWGMVTLNQQNNELAGRNAGLNKSLQWQVKQYQDLLAKQNDMEWKFNDEKQKTLQFCEYMIKENKKHQWCAMCQERGKPYFCSDECKQSHRYVNHV